MENDITKLDINGLKALLFDIGEQSKQLQQQYQQVGLELQKRVEEKAKEEKTAKKLLMEENKKKQEAFIVDYNEVCKKHGMELQPTAGFNIVIKGDEK